MDNNIESAELPIRIMVSADRSIHYECAGPVEVAVDGGEFSAAPPSPIAVDDAAHSYAFRVRSADGATITHVALRERELAPDDVVDAWFEKHFHGLGARLDEFLFNHLRAAKEDLKEILARAR